MNISNGEMHEELLEAVLAEDFFGYSENNNDILLVEGSDDIQVIKKFYYHRRNGDIPFRVVKAEDLNEILSGKKNALKAYEKYKDEKSNLICLFDRDLDFFLNENCKDDRIHYYDFYELENYLFDESILKLFFDRYYDCDEIELFEKMLDEFNNISDLLFHYPKLSLIRELNFKYNFLNEEELDKIVKLSKTKPIQIFNNQAEKYRNLDLLQKFDLFISEELNKVNTSLVEIEQRILPDNVAATISEYTSMEKMFFFKYCISAKFILSSLHFLMQNCIKVGTIINSGNSSSLERTLKKEWIPCRSDHFHTLMLQIENKFKQLS
ncbi:DUF4435 domain-containing protein [Lysinibacillus sp. JNUCC-52]|uniref:DUF4435 domain-containing protein n=1 Tax=Lysinibacillus sp. JNUCC-52 TaxID=2792480 RepID=UPI00193635C3|nr:hypothetical protein JNUCC52_01095 [Lysinibacillus sp. JNUCC-52]